MGKAQIKINSAFPDLNGTILEKGKLIDIKTDSEGTPLDPFWRRHLKMAGNSCEIVKSQPVKSKQVDEEKTK